MDNKNVLAVRDVLEGRAPKETPVKVRGWVRTRRDSKAGFSFIHLSDGSSFHPVQVVAPNALPNYADEVMKLTAGCAVEATGVIVPSPAKGQPFEMQASAVRVVGWVEDPDTYPIQPKPHSLEFLREVAHLRPRTNVIGAATRVRHTVAQAIHRFFHERGFFWVNTPIITAADAEGAGALFRVSTLDFANGKPDFSKDFFGRETFLTVSGQLNVEAYCLALSKVYTFGPTFRAENSNTSRHLAEFWMVEPEIAFADLADDADLAEALLKDIFSSLLKERPEDMAFFDERIEKGLVAKLEGIVKSEFVRMDYTEAIAILERSKEKFEFAVKWGIDLQSEHERFLTEKHAKKPVIVMNYPKAIKAFYMRQNDDGKTVAAMDVLAPGIGEIIGGSQREERLERLDARMDEVGIDKEGLGWYRDLRRYGSVPHAGFGLGFERTIAYVTGLSNVRDAIPFSQNARKREVLMHVLGLRDYRLYLGGRFFAAMSQQMLAVAIGWYLYDLTGDPLVLGYAGLATFLPIALFTLPGGDVSDRNDRRKILALTHLVQAACSAALVYLAAARTVDPWPFYAVLVISGTARAYSAPAAQSLGPFLVPREQFAESVAWNSTVNRVAMIVGPALGGLIYLLGAEAAFAACLLQSLLVSASMIAIRTLVPVAEDKGTAFSRAIAGLRYVRRQPIVFGAITLDLFAVTLGSITALLPVYARDVLDVGPGGLGAMRSSLAVGAIAVALLLAAAPQRSAPHGGKSMFYGVAVFGVAILVFGVSTSFWLSLVALAVMGAADMLSVWVRSTIVPLGTPDDMRGRVSAVHMLFVGTSNELGDFRAGAIAAWLGALPAVMAGGICTLLVTALWARFFPELRRIDRLSEVTARKE